MFTGLTILNDLFYDEHQISKLWPTDYSYINETILSYVNCVILRILQVNKIVVIGIGTSRSMFYENCHFFSSCAGLDFYIEWIYIVFISDPYRNAIRFVPIWPGPILFVNSDKCWFEFEPHIRTEYMQNPFKFILISYIGSNFTHPPQISR